jgi:hypothetical protein
MPTKLKSLLIIRAPAERAGAERRAKKERRRRDEKK